MENKILSSKEFRKYILNKESKKLVGKVCKRIEIIEIQENDSHEVIIHKINIMKKNIKELLYEWSRDIADLFDIGELTVLNIQKDKRKEQQSE